MIGTYELNKIYCDDCYIFKLFSRLAELEDKLESGELVEKQKPKIVYCEESGYWEVLIPNEGYRGCCLCESKAQAEARLKELQEKK